MEMGGFGLTYSARLVTAPDLPSPPQGKDILRDLTGRERLAFREGGMNRRPPSQAARQPRFDYLWLQNDFRVSDSAIDLSVATR